MKISVVKFVKQRKMDGSACQNGQ